MNDGAQPSKLELDQPVESAAEEMAGVDGSEEKEGDETLEVSPWRESAIKAEEEDQKEETEDEEQQEQEQEQEHHHEQQQEEQQQQQQQTLKVEPIVDQEGDDSARRMDAALDHSIFSVQSIRPL
ncbi:unnamed protein product [Closterium sp. NIES-53]